ncbi:hypothetical protein Trydic_g11775 [Trypoxylus dichotomus]
MLEIKKDIDMEEYGTKQKLNTFLYFAAIVVNLACFTCGSAFSWSSPVTPKLHNPSDNPLGIALTEEEISWLVALMSLGASVGPFVGGYLADKIGRKRTFIVSILPFILAYVLLAFGTNLYIYYVARFIKGTCVGLFLTIVPMYVGEIAEVHNRGILGCFTVFFVTIGALFSFTVGPYIPVKWFSLSCVVAPLIFLVIVVTLIPESPSYLILRGKHEQAKRSLQRLRLGDINEELLEITAIVKESSATKGGLMEILRTKYLFKALRLSIGLMVIQQATAITVINYYMQSIFEKSGSNATPQVSVIIVGSIQVLGTFLSTLVVDRLGRRPLLLVSTIFTSLSLYILGLYFYLMETKDLSIVSWLPIATLILYMLAYNLGIGPLAFAVMGEIYPPHVKSVASSISVACCYFSSFIAAKLFPALESGIGGWSGFAFFAIGNSLGVVFIWFSMPETKGKTLLEILEHFK